MNLSKQNKNKDNIIKSVFVAHFILMLHILVIAAIGFLVLFFRGIVIYMPWIFFGGTAAIATSCYLLYRKMKKERKSLKEILSLPVFKNRTVEVSFLGGLASLRVENSIESLKDKIEIIETEVIDHPRRLEDPKAINVKELTELVRLLDNKLITPDEYDKAKQKIFNS